MREFTIVQAAARLGVSVKTVSRWLEAGKMWGKKRANGRLAIPESEIIMIEERRGQEPGRDLAARVVQLEDENTRLAARLAELETKMSKAAANAYIKERIEKDRSGDQAPREPRPLRTPRPPDPPVQQPALIPAPEPEPERQAAPVSASEAPGDLEVTTVFAARHFPGQSTDKIARLAQTLRESGRVPMVPGKWKIGKATASYALDVPGRRAFIEQTRGREGFTRCETPGCPCQA